MRQIIGKEELISWLSQLLKQRVLVAPTNADGLILFQPVTRVEDIVLDFDNTALSLKEWFFPAAETLFTVTRKDGQTEMIPAKVEQEEVLFGPSLATSSFTDEVAKLGPKSRWC